MNFKTFLISDLPLDNVHLAGVDSLNLPFLIANGFNLYQIAWFLNADNIKPLLLKLISYCIFPSFEHRPAESGKLKFQKSTTVEPRYFELG